MTLLMASSSVNRVCFFILSFLPGAERLTLLVFFHGRFIHTDDFHSILRERLVKVAANYNLHFSPGIVEGDKRRV
jgi:hypothetical protein